MDVVSALLGLKSFSLTSMELQMLTNSCVKLQTVHSIPLTINKEGEDSMRRYTQYITVPGDLYSILQYQGDLHGILLYQGDLHSILGYHYLYSILWYQGDLYSIILYQGIYTVYWGTRGIFIAYITTIRSFHLWIDSQTLSLATAFTVNVPMGILTEALPLCFPLLRNPALLCFGEVYTGYIDWIEKHIYTGTVIYCLHMV